MELFEQQSVVWTPDPTRMSQTRLGKFLAVHELQTLDALRIRAKNNPEWFWDAVIKDIDWPFVRPYHQVLDISRGWPWAQWFLGGQTNVALAALDRHARGPLANKIAVVSESDDGRVESLSYRQLQEAVDQVAWGLTAHGIGMGDVVAVFLPMISENVIMVLALAKVGAIFLPIFSGYGPEAMATRLVDAGAKMVVAADGFRRRGRVVDMKRIAQTAVAMAPSVQYLVGVSQIGGRWEESGRVIAWHTLRQSSKDPFPTKVFPSETPLMLIYTSGTTGKPKGAVHTHTGFPLKATQDLWHAFDLQESDVFFWYTDMGWMMGPWMVYGGLISGCTIILYDGTPDFPSPSRLWQMIDRHRVSVFGISPTAIRSLMAYGVSPLNGTSRESLRILGSSGEPWNPGPWQWFFEQVGNRQCPIINYSGGTEISGGIVSAFATEPQKPCAFNGAIPGIPAEVVDQSSGKPVVQAVGELVITGPWPGMTRGFWRDNQRYHEAYWSRMDGVWVHGDWAYIDGEGFWYILGRSDDTIKIAGKRVGPAEVESILVSYPGVSEAAAIGVPHPVKGEALVCFIVWKADGEPDLGEIAETVANQLGRPLKPDVVRIVPELAKTRNGKIVRRAMRAAYLGMDVGDVSAMENPNALQFIGRQEDVQ